MELFARAAETHARDLAVSFMCSKRSAPTVFALSPTCEVGSLDYLEKVRQRPFLPYSTYEVNQK